MNDRLKKKRDKEAFLEKGRLINKKKLDKLCEWMRNVTSECNNVQEALKAIVDCLYDCSNVSKE